MTTLRSGSSSALRNLSLALAPTIAVPGGITTISGHCSQSRVRVDVHPQRARTTSDSMRVMAAILPKLSRLVRIRHRFQNRFVLLRPNVRTTMKTLALLLALLAPAAFGADD